MDKWILRDAERYASAHRGKRRWYRVMTCLAAVVVFCTTYALILPAITLEKQCQIPEHTHTDSCYTQVTSREKSVLACEVEADAVIHKHDAACWDEDGNLVCTLPELEAHRHTDSCYTIPEAHAHTDACYTWERGELTCTQSTEPQHIHTEDCYQESSDLVCGTSESTGHTHGEDCCDDDGNLICGQEVSQGHTHGEGCHQVSRQLICGQTEEPAHQHTDECYSWNQVLTCGQSTEAAQPVLTCEKDEIELHTHQPFVSEEDRGCYDAEGKNLVCGKPQVVEHQHTGACFKTVTEAVDTETLTCTLPEDETHTHTTLCYGTWELTCGLEEHTHSEACTPAEPFYKCGLEAHTHSETCYDEAGELTCGLEEHTHSEACAPAEAEDTVFCGKEAHTHEAECWDENGNLVCTLEEHTHSLACYSDPTADVETQNDWQQSFGDVTLTGNWRQDAVSIAQTQLGYTESTANYLVEDDGQTLRGYTRYGAWYGDPYGDWDAMFVSFCLHYAGAEDIPMDKDCGSWVTALADAFIPAQSHEAAPGELVFFDRDGDGTADYVALVSEVTAGEDGVPSGFTAIAGDVDNAVQQLSYAAEDSTILGYGILPEQAKEFTLTAQTETGITVTISGDSASLPCLVSEVTVTAAEVAEEDSKAVRDQLPAKEDTEPEKRFLLDITLWQGEEEIEPVGPVTVTFSGFDTEGLYPKVYHIDTEANEVTDMEAVKDEAGDITVSTEHFSYYDMQLFSELEGTAIQGDISQSFYSGKKFYLKGDAYTSNTITITGDTTLDLNGYGVYYKGTDNFLVVNSGATLTIKDSRPAPVSESNGSGNLYGNAASLDFSGNKPGKLTYYVTESSASGTGTSETLKKYEVTPTGCIVGEADGGAASIVKVNSGGTCNLEGGLLTIKNSSNYNNGDAHIIFNSGTLNLSGGYVAGGKDACWGGGIYSGNGSTINMTGGVIAANSGTNGGGICIDSGTFNMSSGVISGNCTQDVDNLNTYDCNKGQGGGIFANNATVKIEGGYITNNSQASRCKLDDGKGKGCHGGGGIATIGGTCTMSGGFVTGNYSKEAGGGMYLGHASSAGTTFSMSGGIVASNYARDSEGGGIRISGGTTGVINASGGKVYITNNRTNSTYDWGGGGLFVQEKGNLNITNVLITANRAGGFGGGVGACPTGETLIVHNDGAAIHSNSASGTNMSGGGGGKNYDSEVANKSDVFKNNGYQDYFCVKASDNNSYISLITGKMVGDGAANWQGSCDNSPITISKTGHAAAKYLFGLTSHPDSDAISAAQEAAGVVISGNHSNIHGGGIMTNGGLILGRKETVITATPALDITAEKVLMVDGTAVSSGRDFQFRLTDSVGNEVGTAKADASTGRFTIAPNTKYDTAGTYTYYLTEVNDGRQGVTYDSSQYRIDVTIGEKITELLGVKFKSYYVDTVNVTKSGSGGSSSGGSSSGGSSGGGSETSNTFKIHYRKPSNWSNVYLHIWGGAGLADDTTWPGMQVKPNPNNSGWYTQEFTVTGSGTFKYIFNNGGNGGQGSQDQTGNCDGEYSLGGELWVNADGSQTGKPDGWGGGSTSSGGTTSERTTTPSGKVTLHFHNYDNWNEVALYIWKVSGVDASGYDGDWPGGRVSADSAHTGWYTVSIPVTGTSGSFSFIFNENKSNNGSQTQDLATGDISGGAELWITGSNTVLHAAPAEWSGGSTPSSGVSITTVKNSDGSYSLTINGDAFTNTITTITRMNLQILKTDSNDADKVLKGATFSLKKRGEATGTEATTGENGIATFEGIERTCTKRSPRRIT
ncbi:MAG: starch-binding protein [Oscillospiraceae bacterium]|nr:starch-binding protein [Oscillospiraceae bacterium]